MLTGLVAIVDWIGFIIVVLVRCSLACRLVAGYSESCSPVPSCIASCLYCSLMCQPSSPSPYSHIGQLCNTASNFLLENKVCRQTIS